VLLVGGAYMLLVINNRDATDDIDAIMGGNAQVIRDAAREVANERGL
jgi:hypothetical protein